MINKNLGQYFTTNDVLKEKMFTFILNNPKYILEPSIGHGNLIVYIKDKLPQITFDMYEIDPSLTLLDGLQIESVIYRDFLKENILKTYKTIIGNPPYIKKTKGNLYIDFTKKCYDLLDDNGELIFIVPADFLKLTSASKLLNTMMTNGSFTHIYHPHNEKLFENALIDIIIFRYCKNNLLKKHILYNDKLLYITNSNGLITFSEEQVENLIMFKDYFDIYVGIVSGKETVYKHNELGNISVLNGYNNVQKYIYVDNYPTENHQVNEHLLKHKNELIERRIQKFDETNWFKWGATRNIKIVNKNIGKDCIYIYNLTRSNTVAFLGKVNYFGGNLMMLLPKKNTNLNNILTYLNSDTFKINFIFSKRFKIGHHGLALSFIPNQYLI
jgi:adenine-specific DNA-methyltransferase